MRRWLYTLPLVLVLTSCGYYHVTKQKPDQGFNSLKATLSFATIKQLVLQENCLDCHDSGKYNFTEYPTTFKFRHEIKDDVDSGAMPQDAELPPRETEILMAWLAADAPEFSNLPLPGELEPIPEPEPAPEPDPKPIPRPFPIPEPTPNPEPIPVKVVFEDVKTQIFVPLCLQCHTTFGTYAKVIKRLDDIKFSIENNEMPKDAAPVSDPLKELLKQWIVQGAPEN